MSSATDRLPTPGQHVIARRGTTRLEGTVKDVASSYPLVTVVLDDAGNASTTEFDLWTKDGWTYEVVPEVIDTDRDQSPVVTL